MKATPSNITRQLNRWGLTLALATAMTGAASAETGGTIEVKVGETIPRTYDDVKAAGYAWGQKQEFDDATKETQIWLPYGSAGTYFEKIGCSVSDPEPGAPPLLTPQDGETSVKLVYKLHFDKPVDALRFKAGWSEVGQAPGTVAGVEFSTDGEKWSPIRENDKPGAQIIEPFSDGTQTFKFAKTQDLYVRVYSRDKANPDAATGPGRWVKFRMAGDPSWGDASTTFAAAQLQLWVTSAQ